MFDFQQLRCFVSVAEELHFGRAAGRLHMTQPPLSRQIQMLEKGVGARLFERSNRVVRLTPVGKAFLPEARKILQSSDSALRAAQKVAEGKVGSIVLGFTAASGYRFLPQLITAARERIPDVDIHLEEMITTDQIEALSTGRLDAGLMRWVITQPDYDSVLVVNEPMVVAMPAGHRCCDRTRLTPRDLDGEPFIMYSPYKSSYFYDLVTVIFRRANVTPRHVQYIAQIHSILALVSSGLGMALVPQSATSLRFERVVLRPLRLRSGHEASLFFVWRRNNENPALPLVVELAKQVFGDPQTAGG